VSRHRDKEKKASNQGDADSEHDVGRLIDLSLQDPAASQPNAIDQPRTANRVDALLNLLPVHQRTSSARTGIARRVPLIPPHIVDEIEDALRSEFSGGHVRNHLAYLYACLKRAGRSAA
jgi:hypothetical protein